MSAYADEWAEHVRSNAHEFMWATTALHSLGDISRDDGDFVVIDGPSEDDDHYTGHWLTGFGFVNVSFPKSSTRPLSRVEVEWLADHPVVLA